VQDITENVYDISAFVWHNLNKLKLSGAADGGGNCGSVSLGIIGVLLKRSFCSTGVKMKAGKCVKTKHGVYFSFHF